MIPRLVGRVVVLLQNQLPIPLELHLVLEPLENVPPADLVLEAPFLVDPSLGFEKGLLERTLEALLILEPLALDTSLLITLFEPNGRRP